MCAVCLKRARTRQALQKRKHEECAGLAPSLCAVVAHPRGHVLVAADDDCGTTVVACLKCGNWAESKPRALLRSCRGCILPHTESVQAMRRLTLGMHPQHKRGRLAGPLLAVQAEHQEAASRSLDWHLQRMRQPKRPLARGAEPPCPTAGEPSVEGVAPALAAEQVVTASERLAALRARVIARAR